MPRPAPKITAVRPSVVQLGVATQIVVTGTDLSGVTRVVFDSASGTGHGQAFTSTVEGTPSGNQVKLRVTAEAQAGQSSQVAELRVVTPHGVSNAVRIASSALPFINEIEPNDAETKPQPITLPARLSGVINRPGDYDRFAFKADKGQVLVFDLHAARLGSTLDPVMAVYDPATRRALAFGAFHRFNEMLLVFTAPSQGNYVLAIRDVRYRGGGGYTYQLRAGQLPHLTALLPTAGQRGNSVTVQLLGHNLGKARQTTLSLKDHPLGLTRHQIRIGKYTTNAIPFEVSPHAELAEREPNNSLGESQPVPTPIGITGQFATTGDVDLYRIKIDKPQTLAFKMHAQRYGVAIDSLLEVLDAAGKRIAINDDAAGGDALIQRKLNPGVYHLRVSQLSSLPKPGQTYRLTIVTTTGNNQNFALRFFPDRPTVNRGSHTKLWCEATRVGGFKGPVTVTFADLPKGVTASSVILNEGNGYTSLLTLSAKEDAPLTTQPFRAIATADLDGRAVTLSGKPLVNDTATTAVLGAYVTVLGRPAFVVSPVGPPSDGQLASQQKALSTLRQQLAANTPAYLKAYTAWEQTLANGPVAPSLSDWYHAGPFVGANVTQAFNGVFPPEKSVDLTKPVKTGIKWVKQSSWVDGQVHNPWSAVNAANYLYRTITVVQPRDLPLSLGSDDGVKVFHNGKQVLANNIGRGAAPDQEKITLKLKAGVNHLLIKIVNGVGASGFYFKASAKTTGVPAPVLAALRTPKSKRSAQQIQTLDQYFRSITPLLADVRQKIKQINLGAGVDLRIAELENVLKTATPELAQAQIAWEQDVLKNFVGWRVLSPSVIKSDAGIRFNKQKDGTVRAARAVKPKDNVTFVADCDVNNITAIRLEALPDGGLPGGGPGLVSSTNGNFVLTEFRVTAAPQSNLGEVKPIVFKGAKATFEQLGWPVARTFDNNNGTGWAVAPKFGVAHTALFFLKTPITHGASRLRFRLEHQSPHANHILGKFRLSVTNASKPAMTDQSLPATIAAIIKQPTKARSQTDQQRLASYYRSIAPLLQSVRDELAQLRVQKTPFPPIAARNTDGRIAFRVARARGFTGNVNVALEGFVAGRDGRSKRPNVITQSIDTKPIVIEANQSVGVIKFKPKGNSQVGTRYVVLKATGTVGKVPVVQYSEPIPLTVNVK